ncbi:hypothetical protein [Roseixanthobacter glucoisosaccharinicivorans]|uniref:hypothetical protein n=1 Tax=Roseixanthobacter glucoisosaccharinicivorans TaxID=3119923 RepID=UPI00372BCD32
MAALASTGALAQPTGAGPQAPCVPVASPGAQQACAEPARPLPPVPQNWTLIESRSSDSRSPGDDRPQISASIWVEKDQAILALRCFDGRLEMMVSSPTLVLPDATAQVTYRIEGAGQVTRRWHVAANRQDLFAPDPEGLLRALPDQGTLFIRAEGRARTAFEANFAYRGLNDVRARFAARCVAPPARPQAPPAAPAQGAPENDATTATPPTAPGRPADATDALGIRSLAAPPAPPSFADRPLRRLPEE